jgi:hypothetical protein
MTRREDQPQPLVRDRAHRLLVLVVAAAERAQVGLERRPAPGEAPFAPQPVDRPVARGRDDPGGGIVGQPALGPALERDQERVLDRLLGAVEIAEDAGEDGDRLSRLAPEQTVDENALRSRQDAAAEPALAPDSIAV